jgi:hypothetical protein
MNQKTKTPARQTRTNADSTGIWSGIQHSPQLTPETKRQEQHVSTSMLDQDQEVHQGERNEVGERVIANIVFLGYGSKKTAKYNW